MREPVPETFLHSSNFELLELPEKNKAKVRAKNHACLVRDMEYVLNSMPRLAAIKRTAEIKIGILINRCKSNFLEKWGKNGRQLAFLLTIFDNQLNQQGLYSGGNLKWES